MSGAWVEQKLRIAVPIDLLYGPQFDVLQPGVRRVVRDWIRSGLIWHVHFATECIDFSQAKSAKHKRSLSRLLASFTADLIRLCRRYNVFVTIENPSFSRIWSFPLLAKQIQLSKLFQVNFPVCAFGAPYLKPTTLMIDVPNLLSLNRVCSCTVPHELLRGVAKFK